jgi:hypothetical protein
MRELRPTVPKEQHVSKAPRPTASEQPRCAQNGLFLSRHGHRSDAVLIVEKAVGLYKTV